MADRKSDFALPTLDDLFSTQEERDEARLEKIRDIPLDLIDDFPDHPFTSEMMRIWFSLWRALRQTEY